MMRQMRDNMKWIMGLTAVTFVGLMVFGWGMDITGRTGTDATGGELGRVNGDPITYEQWQSVYRNLYETRQRQTNAPVNAAVNKAIEEDAWNQIVMQLLITRSSSAAASMSRNPRSGRQRASHRRRSSHPTRCSRPTVNST